MTKVRGRVCSQLHFLLLDDAIPISIRERVGRDTNGADGLSLSRDTVRRLQRRELPAGDSIRQHPDGDGRVPLPVEESNQLHLHERFDPPPDSRHSRRYDQ